MKCWIKLSRYIKRRPIRQISAVRASEKKLSYLAQEVDKEKVPYNEFKIKHDVIHNVVQSFNSRCCVMPLAVVCGLSDNVCGLGLEDQVLELGLDLVLFVLGLELEDKSLFLALYFLTLALKLSHWPWLELFDLGLKKVSLALVLYF